MSTTSTTSATSAASASTASSFAVCFCLRGGVLAVASLVANTCLTPFLGPFFLGGPLTFVLSCLAPVGSSTVRQGEAGLGSVITAATVGMALYFLLLITFFSLSHHLSGSCALLVLRLRPPATSCRPTLASFASDFLRSSPRSRDPGFMTIRLRLGAMTPSGLDASRPGSGSLRGG